MRRPTLAQDTTIRLTTTWAIDQAREVVNTLYHSAGSTAIFDTAPFERCFRDVRTASQQAQGRQAHYETIATTRPPGCGWNIRVPDDPPASKLSVTA